MCPKVDLSQQRRNGDPVGFGGNFTIDYSEVRILLRGPRPFKMFVLFSSFSPVKVNFKIWLLF